MSAAKHDRRTVMGHFATGVCVVSTRASDGSAVGTRRADDADAGREVAHHGAHVVLCAHATRSNVCPSRSALESMYGSDSGWRSTSIGTWPETSRP